MKHFSFLKLAYIAPLLLVNLIFSSTVLAFDPITCARFYRPYVSYFNKNLAKQRLKTQNYAEAKLKTAIELESFFPFKVPPLRAISLKDSKGDQLAYCEYILNGDELSSIQIRVPELNKGKGISRLALARMLEIHPEVKSIRTEIIDDNVDVFESYRNLGYSTLDAFMETPAYRIRASLGFTKIVAFEYRGLGRPATGFTVAKDGTVDLDAPLKRVPVPEDPSIQRYVLDQASMTVNTRVRPQSPSPPRPWWLRISNRFFEDL